MKDYDPNKVVFTIGDKVITGHSVNEELTCPKSNCLLSIGGRDMRVLIVEDNTLHIVDKEDQEYIIMNLTKENK